MSRIVEISTMAQEYSSPGHKSRPYLPVLDRAIGFRDQKRFHGALLRYSKISRPVWPGERPAGALDAGTNQLAARLSGP